MTEPVDPPAPAMFYGYLGAVVGVAGLTILLLYLLFVSGFREFARTLRFAPVETVRADPLVIVLLAGLFVCLASLVAIIVAFGARVNRVEIEDQQ